MDDDDDDADDDDYIQEIFHKGIFLSKYQCLQICSSFVMDDGAFPRDFFMLQSFDKKISEQTLFCQVPKESFVPIYTFGCLLRT
jgi:hypothetical protein